MKIEKKWRCMQMVTGKVASFVAGGVVVAGIPLLACLLLMLKMTLVPDAGQLDNRDLFGLALMSALAYAIALLSFVAGLGYFGYRLARHRLRPNSWHCAALAFSLIELVTPYYVAHSLRLL